MTEILKNLKSAFSTSKNYYMRVFSSLIQKLSTYIKMGFHVLDQIVFDPQLTFPVGLN